MFYIQGLFYLSSFNNDHGFYYFNSSLYLDLTDGVNGVDL